MTVRPILFSGPMVRALLEGRKTQTRRVVKPSVKGCTVGCYYGGKDSIITPVNVQEDGDPWTDIPCRHGNPGDMLWVRETFKIVPATAYGGIPMAIDPSDKDDAAVYKADWSRSGGSIPWKPSIFMKRWASRLTLRITDVRVQRLNDIGQGDACAEGAPAPHEPIGWYSELWDSINGAGAWDKNPLVWALTFKVIHANVDKVLKEVV